MQEVIQKMLRVEQDGRKLVEQAQQEARQAAAAAQIEAQKDTEQTLQAARERARRRIEEAAATAAEEKRRLLDQRRADLVASLHVDEARIREAADAVLRSVLGES